MFLFVFFDLPIQTAQDKKAYARFRKKLEYGGFQAFQYSVYMRDCPTHESADKHTKRLQAIAPPGHVAILRVSAKQVGNIVNLYRPTGEPDKKRKLPTPAGQLTLF